MKHLKLFENWLRRTDDKELIEVADYIDDILLDISDMYSPHVEPSMINRDKINFEIEAEACNDEVAVLNKFELSQEVVSVIERCYEYVESIGYQMDIYVRWDVMANATLGEHVDGEGGGVVTLQGLKDFIGKEIHYIGVTVKKK